ncbi:MAG: hypothetical protein AAF492_25875 [Verrucomicrobiota bacterium]
MFRIIVLLTLAAIASSCIIPDIIPTPPVGGPCDYRSISGQALIKSVEPAGDGTDAGQPVKITFSFTPDNPEEDRYPHVNDDFSIYHQPASPTEKSFEVGRTYPCTKDLITKGTCTPWGFRLERPANGQVIP